MRHEHALASELKDIKAEKKKAHHELKKSHVQQEEAENCVCSSASESYRINAGE